MTGELGRVLGLCTNAMPPDHGADADGACTRNVALSGCLRTDASTSECSSTPSSEKEPQLWESGDLNASPSFV